MYRKLLFLLLLSSEIFLSAQIKTQFDYAKPREYEVAEVKVSGVKYLDEKVLADISDIRPGQTITVPGERITKAIEKYWKQGLFSDVKIFADSIVGDKIFLNVYLQERKRLSSYEIVGVKSAEKNDIEDDLKLKKGNQVTDDVLNKIENKITNYFVDKGYLYASVSFQQKNEEDAANQMRLLIQVDKGERVKIDDVVFINNKEFPDQRLERVFEDTREKKLRFLFKSSKFDREKFRDDKKKLIDFYNKEGFRDARIVKDSIEKISEERIKLFVEIKEGKKYYFGNINWVGNSLYTEEQLQKSFGIKKGAIYDQELLQKRLFMDEDAVSSLYLDNGYLFSNINPVEKNVRNDTIDLEMRVFEGEEAMIDRVRIKGNTKTNEHVIRRELRTKPGDLFSKSDIVRSVRELAQLGHFDPEQIEPNPVPNQEDGTVDIDYGLVEKANDQLELSGGWGAGMIIGTIGLRFNNFSARNLLKPEAWKPIPSGDGQTLSLRAQTNGRYYQAYNMTFVEPWFGGKKPNSLSFSIFHSVRSSSSSSYFRSRDFDRWMKVTGVSLGLGQRLKQPDDYFTLHNEVSYQRYNLEDWRGFIFTDGAANNISYKTAFGRNSVDQPIYPRKGSSFKLSLQLTPPFSFFDDRDYATLPDAEKYKWVEYHKWKFHFEWYKGIDKNQYNDPRLILKTRFEFGYLAHYNNEIGPSPFEGFDVGGDGLSI